MRYVERFRDGCLGAAREQGLDGVVCGHIHRADLVDCGGLLYCNDGDWVESCTALVESASGELRLRHGAEDAETVARRELRGLQEAA